MSTKIRSIRGYVSTGVGIIACPCHLAITLPIVLALTAGTAFGAWLSANTGLVFAFSMVLFIGGIGLGSVWLSQDSKPKRQPLTMTERHPELEHSHLERSCECCEPLGQSVIRRARQ
jgi:mercuric ion transport protein